MTLSRKLIRVCPGLYRTEAGYTVMENHALGRNQPKWKVVWVSWMGSKKSQMFDTLKEVREFLEAA